MKIISWNCSQALRKKFPLLQKHNADIIVCQESEKLESDFFKGYHYQWTGKNIHKGIGVLTKKYPYSISKELNDNFIFYLPASFNDFNLMNVWTHTKADKFGPDANGNIIDALNKMNKSLSLPLYISLLNNICKADYIDRITFQKQIWQFNEMSSLIKIFYNNTIFHNNIQDSKISINTIRFTKVLTKYSTEYNNYLFIQSLCQILNMDKKDLFSFFIKLRPLHNAGTIYTLFEQYELTKLDINRIYRYIDKFYDLTESAEKADYISD